MGKIGGMSWLSAFKKAFRSPNGKKSSRMRDDQEHEDDDKRRGKRRWIFKKSSSTIQETVIQNSAEMPLLCKRHENTDVKESQALAVAMATTAAAQAAVATARAAVEVVRLTTTTTTPSLLFKHQHFAAIVIQTAFRGYLAKRALKALKGLVKLQALVRGHHVRKRTKMTLHCMQALIRVQDRVRNERNRISYEESINNSISIPKEENSNGDATQEAVEEIEEMLKEIKENAMKREKALARAFSQQIWKPSRETYASEGELEERPRRHIHHNCNYDPWTRRRASTDHREPIKTVEIDTFQPYTFSTPTLPKSHHYQQQRPSSYSVASPIPRAPSNFTPATPSPSKTRTPQVHSVSPRCRREDRSAMPNYMAATESAKARFRSQSAPKQRPATPEREKSSSTARKRLSFPVPEPITTSNCSNVESYYSLKSPSYKGMHGFYHGMEQRSNISSCCTDSIAGDELALPSTNDIYRWLR